MYALSLSLLYSLQVLEEGTNLPFRWGLMLLYNPHTTSSVLLAPNFGTATIVLAHLLYVTFVMIPSCYNLSIASLWSTTY